MGLPYYDLAIKILLIVICSGIIGYEREKSKKTAGLRTHILVSFGAMFITSIAVLYFTDPNAISRVITGIVTGIGFIGAGAIIRSRGDIIGLTSAAGLWAVAMIGVGVGLGYYMYTVLVTFAVLAILELGYLERKIRKRRLRRTTRKK